MVKGKTKSFQYDPHIHVKIWLSNTPSVFMNTENQTRLISMREKNPNDKIYLVYDSSLLNQESLSNLENFCQEHSITPVDAHEFLNSLTSENEQKLYVLYQYEITHLSEGGNLGVASDILRWLPPVYKLGTYADFDFPIDTTHLPKKMATKAPLLLNIGSLRTGNLDVVLSNNDYIAVVDPDAAKKDIEKIQAEIIKVLHHYETDFIEKTEEEFLRGGFLNKYFISFMKDRSESIYIARSKSIFSAGTHISSRETRKYINEIMTDSENFIQFNKKDQTESKESVIQYLRTELKNQLKFSKWLFFRKEYDEIKNMLKQDNLTLLNYLMKKESVLYLKSIVVCSTGPIVIAKSLFRGYVFNSKHFDEHIAPYSFNCYGLQRAFQSNNSLGLRQNVFWMLRFLGAEDGKLNDSSWLETGSQLQKIRAELLDKQKAELRKQLPSIMESGKRDIETHIQELEANSKDFWGLFFKDRKKAKLKVLREVLSCFTKDHFDTNQFSARLKNIRSQRNVYSGFFNKHIQNLVETLAAHCDTAIILGLTQDRKLKLFEETSVWSSTISK